MTLSRNLALTLTLTLILTQLTLPAQKGTGLSRTALALALNTFGICLKGAVLEHITYCSDHTEMVCTHHHSVPSNRSDETYTGHVRALLK